MEALRIRPLIVAARGLLRRMKGGSVAVDIRAAEARGQRVRVVTPAVEEVHAARIGGAAEHVERRGVEITVHRRGAQADGGVAVAQVALQSAYEVVRQRIDLVVVAP